MTFITSRSSEFYYFSYYFSHSAKKIVKFLVKAYSKPPVIPPLAVSIFHDRGKIETLTAADSLWIKTTIVHRNYYKSLNTPE